MSSEPATARLETLLAEASWLEGLARALVRDREEARDLVQEVWVAAAERAPARIDRPRAWLAEVLRNALRSRRRSQGPREQREHAQVRDAASGAGDVVARAEAQRTLVEHVLALDEPWRSTVLLRFFEGLSSEQIALRSGASASTVRNRLAHALQLLRARLERSHGTDWLAAIAPLVRGTEGATPESSVTPGVTAVAAKGVAVAVVAAALLWWSSTALESRPALGGDEPDVATRPASQPEERESAAAQARRESLGTPAAPAMADAATGAKRAGESEPLPPAGVLEVVVLDGGEVCARSGVLEVAPEWLPYLFPPTDSPAGVRRTPFREGRVAVAGLAPGHHGLRLALDGDPVVCSGVSMPEDVGVRCELQVGRAVLEGFVWNEDGVPVRGSTIVMTTSGLPQQSFRTTSDASGHYRFEGLAPSRYGGTWELGEKKIFFEVSLERGETRRFDCGMPRPWPVWRGALRARTGAAHLGGATLRIRSAQGNPAQLEHAVADDGHFELRLVPGTYALEAEFVNTEFPFRVRLGEFDVGSEDLARDLVLPGARVSGRVYRAEPGVGVTGLERLTIVVGKEGETYPLVRQGWVDADARFAIDALEPGVYLLNAHPLVVDGGRDSMRFELTPGRDELVLEVGVRAP